MHALHTPAVVFWSSTLTAAKCRHPQAWPRERENEYADPSVLAAELRAFCRATGQREDVLPTARALTDAGRHDLLQV